MSLPNTISLGGELGDLPCSLPMSFSIRLDLVSSWVPDIPRPHLARLCAAAIGVSTSLDCRYNISQGDPVQYGGKVLDLLLSKGVSATKVYEYGPKLLTALAESLPQETEVEETAAFIEPPPEDS